MRRMLSLFLLLVPASLGPVVVPARAAPDGPAAAPPAEIVQAVTHEGRTVTVRMRRVALRAPGFEVLVQQAGGGFSTYTPPAERAYLGSVDGRSAAVASAIVTSDGSVEGQVVFDRGATWRFRDGVVHDTDGLTAPSTFAWPSASDATRNVTTRPGQAGNQVLRWDLGLDLDHAWFTSAPVDGSVARALDLVELEAVSLMDVYVPNALLRPALKRVVVRAAAAPDPYAATADLGTARTEWETNQADAGVDAIALHTGTGSGGVAWVGTAGTTSAVSVNRGAGLQRAVLRHEIGHNWGAHDNHTNGPEGRTINSGNEYERFDGTELSAIFRTRDARQAESAPFTPQGRFAIPVPPYAALDLLDQLTGGVAHWFRPLANDHDANGHSLSLGTPAARSAKGGTVRRSGNLLQYVPPKVRERTVDWVRYVVRDSSGQTATGIALFRVDPASGLVGPGSAASAPVVTGGPLEVRNVQSGYYAGVTTTTVSSPLVQRPRSTTATGITFSATGPSAQHAYRMKVAGRCVGAVDDRVRLYACGASTGQRWRVLTHPRTGAWIVNVRSGRCLVPGGTGMANRQQLRLSACGPAHAQAWLPRPRPVATWSRVALGDRDGALVQVASALRLGVPDGVSGSSGLQVRSASADRTRFAFEANQDGSYRIVNKQTGRCVDVYGSSGEVGAEVGTWGCAESANQRFVVLRNPAGAFAVRGVDSGLCLAADPTAGAGLVQRTCGYGTTQRWRLA